MRRMWIAVPLAGVLLAQTQPAKVTLEDLVAGEAGGRDGGRGLLLTADGRYFTGARGDQIQTYRITNGPPGIGEDDCATQSKATALPSNLTLAATWDPTLALAYGQVVASKPQPSTTR
jgi:beta-glucosidase-like glycosyl hydrolase